MAGKAKHQPRSVTKADVEIGKKLRIARLGAKMSQAELGGALGISFQQVQKYEKGVNRIGASRLPQIASVLGVESSFFLDPIRNGRDTPTSEVMSLLTNREVLQLCTILQTIEDSGRRQALIKVARVLAEID